MFIFPRILTLVQWHRETVMQKHGSDAAVFKSYKFLFFLRHNRFSFVNRPKTEPFVQPIRVPELPRSEAFLESTMTAKLLPGLHTVERSAFQRDAPESEANRSVWFLRFFLG